MTDICPVPPQMEEGYKAFAVESSETHGDLTEIDELGQYYYGHMELGDARFDVYQGNFSEEGSDPVFRIVVERTGISENDARYWRVAVDDEGRTLIDKVRGNGHELPDDMILEVAGQVLLEGQPVD